MFLSLARLEFSAAAQPGPTRRSRSGAPVVADDAVKRLRHEFGSAALRRAVRRILAEVTDVARNAVGVVVAFVAGYIALAIAATIDSVLRYPRSSETAIGEMLLRFTALWPFLLSAAVIGVVAGSMVKLPRGIRLAAHRRHSCSRPTRSCGPLCCARMAGVAEDGYRNGGDRSSGRMRVFSGRTSAHSNATS